MVAGILPFRSRFVEPCPQGDFRKALMAVGILMDFDVSEACVMIAFWLARGLLSEDEAWALYVFYGLKEG